MQSKEEKKPLVQILQAAPLGDLVSLPEVSDRFKRLFMVMHGGSAEHAAMKYEAEKFHFMKLLQDKPALQQCTKLSLYGCVMDMAVNGLSFDPAMKHAYIVSFNVNKANKGAPAVWEKRASLMVSGYGELHMRVSQGQIKYADNPVLVYEGDAFRHGTRDNKIFVEHEAVFPRKSDNIIACYLRIERNDSSVDYKVFGFEEVIKLRNFSKDKDSLAWTSGLPGMIQAKTMKHAFRSYPKMRMGKFTVLQSDVIETDSQVLPTPDYGINADEAAALDEGRVYDDESTKPAPNSEYKQEPVANTPVTPVSDTAFLKEEQPMTGKRFTDDDF